MAVPRQFLGMLSDDEALAVLLGLVVGRRAGLITATGKVRCD
jgi:hypothetical protein